MDPREEGKWTHFKKHPTPGPPLRPSSLLGAGSSARPKSLGLGQAQAQQRGSAQPVPHPFFLPPIFTIHPTSLDRLDKIHHSIAHHVYVGTARDLTVVSASLRD